MKSTAYFPKRQVLVSLLALILLSTSAYTQGSTPGSSGDKKAISAQPGNGWQGVFGSKTQPDGRYEAPRPTTHPLRPMFTYQDDFDGTNDTTSLKARGYKIYFRGSGPQGTAPIWFQGNPSVFPAYNGPTNGYVGSNYNSVTSVNRIDNWLVLPALNIAAGDSLVFRERSPSGNPFPDSIKVMYSAVGDSVPEAGSWVELAYFRTTESGLWGRRSFAAPSGGTTARFAIRYYIINGGPSGNNSNYIGIDALTVGPGSEPIDIVQVPAVYALGKVPIPYANPQIIRALVGNVSGSPVTFNLTLTVKDVISGTLRFTNTQTVTALAAGTTQIVSFAGWSATIAENDSLIVTTSVIPGEEVTANNRAVMVQNVNSSRFAYSQGTTASNGVGFDGLTGDFLAGFTSSSAVIDSIQVNFFSGGQPYRVGIWDATGTGGTPGTNLYTSSQFTSAVGPLTLPVGPVAVNGGFFVGVKQVGTTNVSFAFQTESPIRPGTFYYTTPTGGTSWTDFAPGADFRLMIEANVVGGSTMVYDSSTTLQPNTSNVSPGNTNQDIIAVRVNMTGALSPLNVTSITFNTTGTTNPADIAKAKVFFTGSSSTFSTTTQFGSDVISPSGTFSVTGTQALVGGANYFWLAYDIASGATINNFVDGQCTSITVGGTPRTPSVTNPAGARQIKLPPCLTDFSVSRTTGITFTSISGTGTSFAGWRAGTSIDDNRSNATPIGFTFNYMGTDYTTFSASTNGYMDFSSSSATGSGTGGYGYANTAFSSTAGTLLALGPLYDDQIFASGTPQANVMKYQVDGTAPNRILTVEWIAVGFYNGGNPDGNLNYQVKLYEGSNNIEYVYGPMTAPTTVTPSYTLGINGATMSATPGVCELLTQQSANSASFTNTPQNALATIPEANSKITFTLQAPLANDLGVTGLSFLPYLPGDSETALSRELAASLAIGEKPRALALRQETPKPTAYQIDAPVNFKAKVRNFGTSPQSSYAVGWRIDAVSQSNVGNTQPLPVAGTDSLTLTWGSPTEGVHTARAWSVLGTDTNPGNDSSSTISFEILPANVVFQQGFNDASFPPAGWTVINRDGGGTTTWGQTGAANFNPYEGVGKASCNYLAANGFYIDEYLVTPNTGGLLRVTNDPDTLTFWAQSIVSDYPDSLMILVSTTGTDTSNFTTVLDYVNVPKGVWTKFSYPLPSAATRYIAFRYLMFDGGPSGNSSEFFAIDDIRILAGAGGSSTVTLNVPIGTNWNIVSLPVGDPIPNDSVLRVFENSVNAYAYAFVNNQYVQRFTLSKGPGYWIKSSTSYTQAITGTPVDSLTIPVVNNWNMIGSISSSIDTSSARVTPNPANLRASVFYQFNTSPPLGYQAATTIVPGRGYWVKANGAGTFHMHIVGVPRAGKAEETPVTQGKTLDDLHTLTIEDATGGSQTLYFGADGAGEIPVLMYEMPPLPPAGMFDARFSTATGGYLVQTHPAEVSTAMEMPIAIQTESYPVTVRWKINGTAATYELSDGAGGVQTLRGEGTMRIGGGNSHLTLRVTGSGTLLPKEYALYQNYPNPFNPTTTIKYALPVDSKVTVELYNIIGQRVRTLVNTEQAAGYYLTDWNGQNDGGAQLASGMYFMRMSAGGKDGRTFSDVRKVMLLK
jgi:hypothetical protein